MEESKDENEDEVELTTRSSSYQVLNWRGSLTRPALLFVCIGDAGEVKFTTRSSSDQALRNNSFVNDFGLPGCAFWAQIGPKIPPGRGPRGSWEGSRGDL